jgi:hypothetical protein
MLPAQLFGLLNNAIVVTMATKCNSHQQYSAVLQQLYPSCTKFLIIFGKHPQFTATPSGSYFEYSNTHTFLYYTDNLNPVHYNFTAVYMWNNANYTDVTEIHMWMV